MKPFYATKLALFIAILTGFGWSATAQTYTFLYTGTVQTLSIPAGITVISVDCRGAIGGATNAYASSYGGYGGPGGREQCLLNVSAYSGGNLSVYIGGIGSNGSYGAGGGDAGGGAAGGAGGYYGGGGGGSSDIRPVGGAAASRLVVAGGGGGGGTYCGTDVGGTGGGLVGGTGGSCEGLCYEGIGGSQTAGGMGGTCGYAASGGFGAGGAGYEYSGGGGGGWYGGGGGYYYSGGGGGSSYASAALAVAGSIINTAGYNTTGAGGCNVTIPPPGGTISATTLAFGPIVVGSVSATQAFSINFYNLSPASGSGSGSGLAVTAPPCFEVSTDSMTWSAPGGTVYVTYSGGGSTARIYVQFVPCGYTSYSSTLSISGGSITAGSETVTLTGTGVFPCYGTPAAGAATASVAYSNPTTPFTLGASGEAVGGGVTYSWVSSPYPTFGFTPIVGVTTPTLSVTGISTSTYYELVTTCPGSGISSASTPVEVMDTVTVGVPGCGGYPTVGTVMPDVAAACAPYNANLYYSSSSTLTGLIYQWQYSPDNGVTPFAAITGATNTYYTTSVTGTAYYNLMVTCNNSGLSTTTASTSVGLLTVPTAITGNLPVCNPIPTILSSSPLGGSWTSSAPAIATVTLGSGTVNGVSSGITTITYKLADGCLTTLSVAVSPAPVAIAGTSNVCAGSSTSAFFDATTGGAWTSSNTSIATVGTASSLTGVVHGVSAGSANISYSLPSGCVATYPVVVNPLPAAIAGPSQVCIGSTINLTDATAGGTWVSSTYSARAGATTGIITGAGPGSTNIVYTLSTGCQATKAVTVNSLPNAITGSASTPNACIGLTTTLTETTGGGVWSSSNASVASVASGVVTAVAAGNATISYSIPATGCYQTIGVVSNPLPAINRVTVTNGGYYCNGASGVHIGLNGSSTGVNYDLWLGGMDLTTTTLPGASAALDYGLFTNTGSTPLVYTAVATNTVTGCVSNMSGSATVYPAEPLPNPYTVMGGGTNCNGGTGETITMNGSDAGVTYQLYNGSTLEATATGTGAPTLSFGTTFTANGLYTANAINTTTGCSNSMLGGATVSTAAPINIYTVTGGGNYCLDGVGSPVSLSNSDIGITYALSVGGVVTASVTGTGSSVPFGPQTTTGTYTVIASNTGTSCTQAMAGSVRVGTLPLPTAYAVTGGGNYCTGGDGTHVGVAFSITGVNYELFNSSFSSTTPIATVPGSYSGLDFGLQTLAGTYNVVAVNTATGCSNNMAGTAFIGVSALPNMYPVTGGGAYCQGGTGVDINLGGTSDIGVEYQLYDNGTAVGAPMSSTSGGMVDFGNVTAAGTYYVVAKNPSTTCMDTMAGSTTVSINPIPAAYNVMGGGNYCVGGAGSPVMLNNSQAGITYQAYQSGTMSGTSVISTGGALSLGLFPITGTYTVMGNIGTCYAEMNGSVNIGTNPLPAVYAVTGGGAYCAGSTGKEVGLALTNAGINYQLLLAGVPTGLPAAGTGYAFEFGTETAAGTYQVVATNPLTGCVDTMSGNAVINVNTPPTAYTVINGGAYCAGGTGKNVSLSNSVPSVSYTVYNGGTAYGTAYGTGSILNFPETAPGVYTAVGTDANGCTTNMLSSTSITVNPNPAVFAVTGGGNYCAGSSTGLPVTLASSTDGINYELFYTSGTGTTNVASAISSGGTLTFPPQMGAGSYTVVAQNTVTGCTSDMTGSATIGITPNVTPTVMVSTGIGDSVCSGNIITFSAMSTNGGTSPTFVWKVGPTVVSTSPTYSYMPTNGDVVSVAMTSNANCPLPATVNNSQTISVLTTETPSAMITAAGGNTVCPGVPVSFTASTTYGGSAPSYSWLVNGNPTGTGATFTHTPLNSDDVMLVLTSNYPCRTATSVNSNNIVFDVNTPVTPAFSLVADPGTSINKYTSVLFSANVTSPNLETTTFSWTKNGGTTPVAITPTYTAINLANNDVISLTITNTAGTCGSVSTTQSLTMSVSDLGVGSVKGTDNDIKVIPNPNNGSFTVKGSLAATTDQQVTLEITDMLGQVVYTGKVMVPNGVINENVQLNGNIANGMYLLNVHTDSGNTTFHFVIGQ